MSESPEKDIVEILREWAYVEGNEYGDPESYVGAACRHAADEIELWRNAFKQEVEEHQK